MKSANVKSVLHDYAKKAHPSWFYCKILCGIMINEYKRDFVIIYWPIKFIKTRLEIDL